MNTMKWLIKREYWEHRGGIYWAPILVGAFFTLILFVGTLLAVLGVRGGDGHINGIMVNDLSQHMSQEDKVDAAQALSMSYLPSIAPLLGVMAFVIFFYSLSSLYDDRKDRSILFWKSMPASDSQTVFSKLFTILVITPLVALGIGSIVSVIFFLTFGIAAQMIGLNIMGTALGMSDLYLLPLQILGCLPVYIIWAFPCVAWLMMVSAWARQVPILWAVGIPVILGILLSISEGMLGVGIPYEWYWENIVGRFFAGFVPGTWFGFFEDVTRNIEHGPNHAGGGFEVLKASWAILLNIKIWIAVALGAAMTYAAIRLRRYRDEG